MKKLKLIILIVGLAISFYGAACEQWTQMASFAGDARHRCTGFSVGNKGYIGGGHINSGTTVTHEDYWQYDPGSDSWTQIADFGGGKRYHSVAFAIGEFGYVGCGEDNANTYHNDFYRYSTEFNLWQPIASFPGAPRRASCSFVINEKAYVGTGQSDFGYHTDFYRYDPILNAWSGVAPFPGQARSAAVAFSNNGKGYVGTGHILGDDTKDFYEYTPVTNSWVQKADVGPYQRQDAAGFVISGKGYIFTGNDVDGTIDYKDVWQYDFQLDQWTQIEDFCGTSRRYFTTFVINNVGYAGTGTDGTNLKDFWRFDPLLSVHENDKLVEVTPYPNPSNQLINFNLGLDNYHISIYSVKGELCFETMSFGNLVLDKQQFGVGEFIYSIAYENGKGSRGKIIFQ